MIEQRFPYFFIPGHTKTGIIYLNTNKNIFKENIGKKYTELYVPF